MTMVMMYLMMTTLPLEGADTDNDGIGNNEDTDDDGDDVLDIRRIPIKGR